MRNKILAVVVGLTGFACLAMVGVTSASTTRATSHATQCPAGTTANGDYCTCPPGSVVADYCTACPPGTASGDYCTCPAGTTVSDYCTCPSGTTVSDYCTCPPGNTVGDYCTCPPGSKENYCETLFPQGAPTVSKEHLWGVRHFSDRGPALKFQLKAGIDGAPDLASFSCTLPKGLRFLSKKHVLLSLKNVKSLTVKGRTLTVVLKKPVGSLLVYIKNSSIAESAGLERALTRNKSRKLTFHITVTDATGKKTSLAFSVRPSS